MNTDIEARLKAVPVAGRLANKVALITGAGGGQGQAAALLFARAGATVLATDVDAAAVDATRALAAAEGLAVHIALLDVTDQAAAAKWVDDAAAAHGGIDILYNNAARTHFAPVGEMTLEQWRDTLRHELDIVFIPTRAAWAHMVRRGGGSIINIASVSGMRGTELMGASAHAAGKGGVIGFTRQLAIEGAPHWIRANTISPGPIVTPATRVGLQMSPEFARQFTGWPMLARTGTPIDVAFAALYLASDEASFVTGANLTVDGGMTAKSGFTPH